MNYRYLGRTGLQVSPLCLGTMNFGSQTEEADSFAIMDRAIDAGINFFDTANGYSGSETEKIIGRWFSHGGGRREKVVLATKVYGDVAGNWPNDSKLSARHIRDACEASLRRLQTDHIDLYQMHHVDRHTPWDEIWQAMDLLVDQGKVIYVGSSNFAGWHIVSANEAARRRNSLGLVSEQSLYNLKTRNIELEVIPACEANGIGILPWSPLGGGLLAGSVANATDGRRSEGGMKAAADWLRDTLQKWETLCSEIGERPADVALAWLLANPVVTAPIIGPRTIDQLEGSLRSIEILLDGETLERLDRIFPGPGPAPEAYAW
ncbi:MAG TPA: aldo/keto reductase [Acidimicrobiales bacterium]|nr:aldo/keto reductase [Acidimicrobiales bacterium]